MPAEAIEQRHIHTTHRCVGVADGYDLPSCAGRPSTGYLQCYRDALQRMVSISMEAM
jgi:hypothetical protein